MSCTDAYITRRIRTGSSSMLQPRMPALLLLALRRVRAALRLFESLLPAALLAPLHQHLPPVPDGLVQVLDGAVGPLLVPHLHKREPSGLARHRVAHLLFSKERKKKKKRYGKGQQRGADVRAGGRAGGRRCEGESAAVRIRPGSGPQKRGAELRRRSVGGTVPKGRRRARRTHAHGEDGAELPELALDVWRAQAGG